MEQSRINVVNLHVLSSIQTAINELDDLSAFTRKDDDIFCSNAEFDLHVGDLSDFMDSTEKDGAVNCVKYCYFAQCIALLKLEMVCKCH